MVEEMRGERGDETRGNEVKRTFEDRLYPLLEELIVPSLRQHARRNRREMVGKTSPGFDGVEVAEVKEGRSVDGGDGGSRDGC